MGDLKSKKTGHTILVLVLVITLAVVLLAVGGWIVYQHNQTQERVVGIHLRFAGKAVAIASIVRCGDVHGN